LPFEQGRAERSFKGMDALADSSLRQPQRLRCAGETAQLRSFREGFEMRQLQRFRLYALDHRPYPTRGQYRHSNGTGPCPPLLRRSRSVSEGTQALGRQATYTMLYMERLQKFLAHAGVGSR